MQGFCFKRAILVSLSRKSVEETWTLFMDASNCAKPRLGLVNVLLLLQGPGYAGRILRFYIPELILILMLIANFCFTDLFFKIQTVYLTSLYLITACLLAQTERVTQI